MASFFLFYCRILLQPDDSLQILAPVEADVGFYACNASNALGSDSVSIAVTLAGMLSNCRMVTATPVILSVNCL